MASALFTGKSGMPSIPGKSGVPAFLPSAKPGTPVFSKSGTSAFPATFKPGVPPKFNAPKPAPAANSEAEFEKQRTKIEEVRTGLDIEAQKRGTEIKDRAAAECEVVRKRVQTVADTATEKVMQARAAVDEEWGETMGAAQALYENIQEPVSDCAPKQANRDESAAALRSLTQEIAGVSAEYEGRLSEVLRNFSEDADMEISASANQLWEQFSAELMQASAKLENMRAKLGKA